MHALPSCCTLCPHFEKYPKLEQDPDPGWQHLRGEALRRPAKRLYIHTESQIYIYIYRTCPVQRHGRARTNLGRAAGRDLSTAVERVVSGGGRGRQLVRTLQRHAHAHICTYRYSKTHLPSGEVSCGEKMALRGIEPESYITECTLAYEDKTQNPAGTSGARYEGVPHSVLSVCQSRKPSPSVAFL